MNIQKFVFIFTQQQIRRTMAAQCWYVLQKACLLLQVRVKKFILKGLREIRQLSSEGVQGCHGEHRKNGVVEQTARSLRTPSQMLGSAGSLLPTNIPSCTADQNQLTDGRGELVCAHQQQQAMGNSSISEVLHPEIRTPPSQPCPT